MLLVTPESMLLSHGGSVQILSGIPGRTSIFSPPEQHQTTEKVDLEKVHTTRVQLLNKMTPNIIYSATFMHLE